MRRDLLPGDVVVVRTPDHNFWDRVAAALIRFGAALEGRANLDNHVAIVHHRDDAGILWGIEGRPGGVGWVDLSTYDNRYLWSNAPEPKTDDQRHLICDTATAMLGVGYDWTAILDDGLEALRLEGLWRLHDEAWHLDPAWYTGASPAHVVCSSLADYLYGKAGLAHPGRERLTTPADWLELMLAKGWR